jgi:hypothetical protein
MNGQVGHGPSTPRSNSADAVRAGGAAGVRAGLSTPAGDLAVVLAVEEHEVRAIGPGSELRTSVNVSGGSRG